MFHQIVSSAFLAALALGVAWADEPSASPPPSADAAQDLSLVDPPENVPEGIRFVQSRQMVGKELRSVVMPLKPGVVSKVPLGTGLPALRVPFPEDNIIRLYETTSGVPCDGTPMLYSSLPEKHGDKMLGVLLPGKDGVVILFIDEADCKPGITLFRNLTGNTYLLHAPSIPKVEKDMSILIPGGAWTFGSNMKGGHQERYPLEIRKEITDKKGKKMWYMERKMLLRRELSCGLLILLLPDVHGGLQMIQEISLYKDA